METCHEEKNMSYLLNQGISLYEYFTSYYFIVAILYFFLVESKYVSYFIFGKIYHYTTTKITPTKDRVIIKKTNGDPLLGQFQLRKPVTSLDA